MLSLLSYFYSSPSCLLGLHPRRARVPLNTTAIELNSEDLTPLTSHDCLGWKQVMRNRAGGNYQHLFSVMKNMFECKDRFIMLD